MAKKKVSTKKAAVKKDSCKTKIGCFAEKEKAKLMEVKKKLQAEFKVAKAKLIKAEKDMMDYVHKNPEKSAGIAAGVGAAIGAGIAAVVMRKKKK